MPRFESCLRPVLFVSLETFCHTQNLLIYVSLCSAGICHHLLNAIKINITWQDFRITGHYTNKTMFLRG